MQPFCDTTRYRQPGEGAFCISDFLTPFECQSLIERAEAIGFGEAPVNTGQDQVRMPAVRNNDRVMVDDRDLAATLWARLEKFCPNTIEGWHAVGLNERFRFYRYTPGQVFRWHRDGKYRRRPTEESRLTFMVYLNDVAEGGATDFRTFEVQPVSGTALVFEHQLIHEGAELISGVKYVLRSDVIYAHAA